MGIVVKRPAGSTMVDGKMVDNEEISTLIIDTLNSGGDVTIPTDWDVYEVNPQKKTAVFQEQSGSIDNTRECADGRCEKCGWEGKWWSPKCECGGNVSVLPVED